MVIFFASTSAATGFIALRLSAYTPTIADRIERCENAAVSILMLAVALALAGVAGAAW